MFLAIFEPPNSSQKDFFEKYPTYFIPVTIAETIIVSLFCWETFMEIYHRAFDDARSFRVKFTTNYKVIFKLLVSFLFFLDLIVFHAVYPDNVFRFARPFRPLCLALYQKQLRRTLTGIIQSLNQMVDILIFFFFIILIYAIIGNRVIGDLGGDVEYDHLESNFNDFGITLNNMYLMLSRDNYPGIMIPSYHTSPYYLLYFIPYLIVNLFLLVPLPIAVMFEAFRTHRGKLVVKDRIKEREALLACFVCMDQDYSLKLELPELENLFNIVYGGRLKKSKIVKLFQLMDRDNKEYLNLNDFFDLIDIMENNKSLSKPEPKSFVPWVKCRHILNKTLKIKKIVNNIFFELFMMIVVILNTVTILIYFFSYDQDTLDTIDSIDQVIIWIYCAEAVMKILGNGLLKYFKDGWNLVDFFSTVLSVVLVFVIDSSRFSDTAKTARALRSLRLQRALKLIRILRFIKFFRCFQVSFISIRRVELLYKNLILCFPIVLKLALILFMVSYTYAVIGMELFNSEFQHEEKSHYIVEPYTNFDNIGTALLSLFHIVNEAKWTDFELDFIERFGKLGQVAAFFNTYHVISNLIIISLLEGLILEVFTFMTSNLEEQSKFAEILEELERDERNDLVTNPDKDNKEPGSMNSVVFTEQIKNSKSNKAPLSKEFDESIDKQERERGDKKSKSVNIGTKQKDTTPNVIILKKTTFEPSATIKKLATATPKAGAQETEPDESKGSEDEENKFKDYNNGETNISSRQEENVPFDAIAETQMPKVIHIEADSPLIANQYPRQLTKNTGDSDDIPLITTQRDLEISKKSSKLSSKPTKTKNHHMTYIKGVQLIIPDRSEESELIGKTHEEYVLYEEDESEMDKYLRTELDFFKKKITILINNSIKFHQFEFALPPIDGAPKFSTDMIYLKLDQHEDTLSKFDFDDLDMEKIKELKETASLAQYKKLLEKIKKKKYDLGNYNPTVDRIIRKALLRGADINVIENFEENYLRQTYGSLFDSMKNRAYEHLLPTIETENHCIIRLMRLMKQPDLIATDVIEIIYMIEQSINKNLLQKGSVGKFVFKDSKERWFCLHQNNGRMKLKYVKYGVWNHFNDLFPDKTKIYHSQDIFYNAGDKNVEKVVRRLHNVFQQFSIINEDRHLQSLSRDANIWSMYISPFETESVKGLRNQVSRLAAQLPQISFESLAKLLVTKGVFVSLNYSAATADVDVKSKSSPYYRDPNAMNVNQKLRKQKTVINGVVHELRRNSIHATVKAEFVLDMNNLGKKNQKDRRGSFDAGILADGADKEELHREFSIKKKPKEVGTLHARDISENLFKTSNHVITAQKKSLPVAEYENFLGDLKDIIHWNTDYLLSKVNAFYMCHVAKNVKIAKD